MKNKKSIQRRTYSALFGKSAALLGMAVTLGLCTPSIASAANTALILKTGSFTLSTDRQTIAGQSLILDDSASGILGVEFEWRQASGLAYGVELVRHETDVTSTGTTARSTMETFAVLGTVKKYFSPSKAVRPYIGAGIGAASVDFNGNLITGSGGGLGLQAMGGVEFRGQKVGLYTELKYLSAKVEDDANQDADGSGTGIFVGLSIFF